MKRENQKYVDVKGVRLTHLAEIGYEGDLIYEISSNNGMPAALKDITARNVYMVGEYLLSLVA